MVSALMHRAGISETPRTGASSIPTGVRRPAKPGGRKNGTLPPTKTEFASPLALPRSGGLFLSIDSYRNENGPVQDGPCFHALSRGNQSELQRVLLRASGLMDAQMQTSVALFS